MRTSVAWALFVASWFACCGARSAVDPATLVQARELIGQGNAEQAYALLALAESDAAGDPEFDYWLGVAALDSGRHAQAVAAFERVLAVRPAMASARLDLARAYFILGSFELARREFESLLQENPTPEGRRVIQKFLTEIDVRRRESRRRYSAYIEIAGGHDNNISNTTNDFTGGVLAAFGIPGVEPTGNSIRRSAYYGMVLAGFDAAYPLNPNVSLTADMDGRARGYRGQPMFNVGQLEARVGVQMRDEDTMVHVGPQAQAYRQRGAAPESASGVTPRSDRNSHGGFMEIRRTLTRSSLLVAGAQYNRFMYVTNRTQDTDQWLGSVSLLKEWSAGWTPVTAFTAYSSRDKAVRPLNEEAPQIDVSRRQAGVRVFGQVTPWSTLDAQLLLGYSVRMDEKEFARADTVGIGRDRTAEADLALVWRLAPGWAIRPHVSYTRNQSNIDLYNYSKTEASLALRYDLR